MNGPIFGHEVQLLSIIAPDGKVAPQLGDLYLLCGYHAVGEWADDYTFVVNTTGFHEAAWADELGHPRSQDAKVEERYHRVDHDTLELTVTIDDPKSYTKPFVAMKLTLKWAPKQEFEEQLCIPSEAADYRETFRAAGEDK